MTYTLKITRLEPNLPPLEGIELQRFKRHFWKWHGSGNKTGGWPILGFDFDVLKNRLIGVWSQALDVRSGDRQKSGLLCQVASGPRSQVSTHFQLRYLKNKSTKKVRRSSQSNN